MGKHLVVMVMSAEHAHHITHLFHHGKHTAVETWRKGFFHTGAIHHYLGIGNGFIIFWKGIMHESQCRDGLAAMPSFIGCTLIAIPGQLVESEPPIVADALDLCPSMGVKGIKQSFRCCPVL